MTGLSVEKPWTSASSDEIRYEDRRASAIERLEHHAVVSPFRRDGQQSGVDRDPDQAWFWTPEWQAKERAVDTGLAAGEHGPIYQSGEEFLSVLRARAKRHADV